jgi:hypothetical protein
MHALPRGLVPHHLVERELDSLVPTRVYLELSVDRRTAVTATEKSSGRAGRLSGGMVPSVVGGISPLALVPGVILDSWSTSAWITLLL